MPARHWRRGYTSAMVPILGYARATVKKSGAVPPVYLFIGIGTTALVAALWWGISYLLTERALAREAAFLLTANAPTLRWNIGMPPIDAAGHLPLPDGRTARLEGVPARLSSNVDVGAEIRQAVQRLPSSAWGCTIVKDSPTQPVVQVWALSPRASSGMCGLSSAESRRRGAMLVWRNLGTFAALNGDLTFDFHVQGQPLRISVLGH
jgi:hypothetical protein